VAEIDKTLPLTQVKTQEAQIDDYLAHERLFASLVSLFSAIALVLASVGLYGSVSYNVTSRTRELGVRMALGAGRLAVMRMLLGQVAVTIADPASLVAASLAVASVALLAAFLPARRAMRIDPVRALRYE